jgi:hypothetical protein
MQQYEYQVEKTFTRFATPDDIQSLGSMMTVMNKIAPPSAHIIRVSKEVQGASKRRYARVKFYDRGNQYIGSQMI